jgi:hypothetical protein
LEPDRRDQVVHMLKDEGRRASAVFCAYHRQCRALNLRPWEDPPCHIDLVDVDEADAAAALLLRRLLAAGLSRYEPDPLAALEDANADARR